MSVAAKVVARRRPWRRGAARRARVGFCSAVSGGAAAASSAAGARAGNPCARGVLEQVETDQVTRFVGALASALHKSAVVRCAAVLTCPPLRCNACAALLGDLALGGCAAPILTLDP